MTMPFDAVLRERCPRRRLRMLAHTTPPLPPATDAWRRALPAGLLLLALTALAGCAASVDVRPLASAEALDYDGEVAFVELEGRRVAYRVEGVAGGETLLFIHPWGAHLGVWSAVTPAFTDRYQVARLDLPGHGKSARPSIDYDIDLAARAVIGLIDHLGLERVTLIGNSLGGGTALAVIRERPDLVARLVLIDALGGGPIPGFAAFFIERYFTAELFAGVDDGLVELFANGFVFERVTPWSDAFLSDLLSLRASPALGHAWSLAVSSYLRAAVDFDATPWLPSIRAPTLIVWGDDDWIVWMEGAERLATIPGARLVLIDDCGHMPEVERPEALVERLDAFLRETPLPTTAH